MEVTEKIRDRQLGRRANAHTSKRKCQCTGICQINGIQSHWRSEHLLPLKSCRARFRSIHNIDHKPIDAAVETRKFPKPRRSDVVVNVVRILTIGQIE